MGKEANTLKKKSLEQKKYFFGEKKTKFKNNKLGLLRKITKSLLGNKMEVIQRSLIYH